MSDDYIFVFINHGRNFLQIIHLNIMVFFQYERIFFPHIFCTAVITHYMYMHRFVFSAEKIKCKSKCSKNLRHNNTANIGIIFNTQLLKSTTNDIPLRASGKVTKRNALRKTSLILIIHQFKCKVDIAEMAGLIVETFYPVVGEAAAPDDIVATAQWEGNLNAIAFAGYVDFRLR